MIVNILPKKLFLADVECLGKGKWEKVFISCFPLLYSYHDILLGDLVSLFPSRLKNFVTEKSFTDSDFIQFSSDIGILYLISIKQAEPGNSEQFDRKIDNFEKNLEYMNLPRDMDIRVNFSSFLGGESERDVNRILAIFAKSDKRFVIYR